MYLYLILTTNRTEDKNQWKVENEKSAFPTTKNKYYFLRITLVLWIMNQKKIYGTL